MTPTMLFFQLLLPLSFACPDLWIALGDNCYKTSPEPMTWFQAEEYCFLEGGYLSEIRDENEQASLPSFLSASQYYWLGLTDLSHEGTFVWQTDYREAEYTHWEVGQPSNYGNKENCVHLWHNFNWNDLACDLSATLDDDGNVGVHALCETENLDQFED